MFLWISGTDAYPDSDFTFCIELMLATSKMKRLVHCLLATWDHIVGVSLAVHSYAHLNLSRSLLSYLRHALRSESPLFGVALHQNLPCPKDASDATDAILDACHPLTLMLVSFLACIASGSLLTEICVKPQPIY